MFVGLNGQMDQEMRFSFLVIDLIGRNAGFESSATPEVISIQNLITERSGLTCQPRRGLAECRGAELRRKRRVASEGSCDRTPIAIITSLHVLTGLNTARGHFQHLSAWITSVLPRCIKDKSIQLDKPAPVEAEIFIASVHGALLSARADGDAKMFGAIIHPVLARLAKK